jgi:hypothetical protein
MHDAHSSGHGSGERKLQAQTRRRAIPFVLLLLLGGALGFGLAWAEAGRLAQVAPAVLWCGIGLLAAAVIAAIVAWMRRVDEVEVADQLWSSFVGLQALTLGAFGWKILAAAGEPLRGLFRHRRHDARGLWLTPFPAGLTGRPPLSLTNLPLP